MPALFLEKYHQNNITEEEPNKRYVLLKKEAHSTKIKGESIKKQINARVRLDCCLPFHSIL